MIKVGYARADITPDFSVPLAGFGNSSTRMSQGYVNRQYATCIAITDEKNKTVLLFGQDQCITVGAWTKQVRALITAATGVPRSHIMISSTHNHATVDVGNKAEPSVEQFHKLYDQKLVEAAVAAMADRAPAKIETGRAVTGPLNHVRHYYLDNGTVAGDNYGDFSSGNIVGHTTEADRRMQLIRFSFEKKDPIVLVNWQAHPDSARQIGYTSVSPSWIGPLRNTAEQLTGMHVAYFTGASGG